MSMGLRSKNLQNEVMQPQEAELDRLEIVQCAADITLSNFNFNSGQSHDFCALLKVERDMAHVIDSSTHSAH